MKSEDQLALIYVYLQAIRCYHQVAEVGYFQTTFVTTGIKTELTASRHAGILHYTFPASPGVVPAPSNDVAAMNLQSPSDVNSSTTSLAHVLVDLAHALPSGGGGYIAQRYVKGDLHIAEDGSGYSGSAWYDLGWNQGEAWQICA